MVTGIGVHILLSAAAPVGLPALAVVVPLAADPVLMRARLVPPRPITVFTAPQPLPDLRRHTRAEPRPLARLAPVRMRFAALDTPVPNTFGMATLIAGDPEAGYTGRRLRRPGMAAGLRLRMVNADGVLASDVGMSGAVGKALTRLAREATE